jgi:predicted HAD superfamily Cof-like phosphohydrolase
MKQLMNRERPFQQVYDFHFQLGLSLAQPVNDKLVAIRMALIYEELSELVTAFEQHNRTTMIDGLMDLLYVSYGTCLSFTTDVHVPHSVRNMNALHWEEEFVQSIHIINYALECLDQRRMIYLPITRAVLFQMIIDRIYYISEALMGFDLPIAFSLVHESNMSKLCSTEEEAKKMVAENQTSGYRQICTGQYLVAHQKTGKILKGPHYHPPEWSTYFNHKN